MDQQRPATNPPAEGTAAQRETTAPSSEIETLYRAELLCIGFIGLLHNGIFFFLITCYFCVWASVVSYVTKEERDHPTKDNYYEYELLKITKGQAICYMILHIIGMVVIFFALRMDYFLRFSMDPTVDRIQVATILQKYWIANNFAFLYCLIMLFVVCIYIPPKYKYAFIGMMMGSLWLRVVCVDIVGRYMAIVATSAGIKLSYCGCFNPKKARVQPAAQTEPSTQEVQQV